MGVGLLRIWNAARPLEFNEHRPATRHQEDAVWPRGVRTRVELEVANTELERNLVARFLLDVLLKLVANMDATYHSNGTSWAS